MVMLRSAYETWAHKLAVFDHAFLHHALPVEARTWQSVDISDRSEMRPRELLNVTIEHQIPQVDQLALLQELIEPNMPWAEEHFQERICGQPLNPPPSHERWPYAQKNNDEFRADEQFSHTYPERFWPRFANVGGETPEGRQIFVPHVGIRFEYGDLRDLVLHLQRDPYSRQAYLPVWFPEDTGVTHGARVPCTLGYHFIIRDDRLHCVYYIRSCDYMRHFADDVYMAMRLTQWIAEQLDPVGEQLLVGDLTMHITSFHVFEGDLPILRLRSKT